MYINCMWILCNYVHSVLSLMLHCKSSRNGFSASEQVGLCLGKRIFKKTVSCPKFGRIASSVWLWLGTTSNKAPQNGGSRWHNTQTTGWWSTSSTPSSEHEAHARDLLSRKNLDPLQRSGGSMELPFRPPLEIFHEASDAARVTARANPLTSVLCNENTRH